MGIVSENKRRLKAAIVPALCACAMAYFGYHAVGGERGLNTYARLKEAIAETQDQLTKAVAERQNLERRVRLLGPRALDADMLDEQARLVLGFVHPDDVVIFVPSSPEADKAPFSR
jgi:cell division protein FtsB